MRILHVSDAYPPDLGGGAEVYAHRLASAQARAGDTVEALATAPRSGPREYSLEGVRVKAVASGRIVYNSALDLEGSIGNPEVIHLHNVRGFTAAAVRVLSRAGAPIVWTVHDYYPVCPRLNMVRSDGVVCSLPANAHCPVCFLGRIESLPRPQVMFRGYLEQIATRLVTLPRIDLFIAPSAYMARALAAYGLAASRIRNLPHGVPDRGWRPAEPNSHPVFVGRIDQPHKGLPVLLDAMAMTRSDVGLDVVGLGDVSAARALIARKSLGGRVRLIGQVKDVQEAYLRSSFVVVPSLWHENFPLVVAEAQMAGRAVLGSAVGGIPEIVVDGSTGQLVPPGDSEALARALDHLATRPDRLAQMGNKARIEAQRRLNFDHHVRSIREVYAELA